MLERCSGVMALPGLQYCSWFKNFLAESALVIASVGFSTVLGRARLSLLVEGQLEMDEAAGSTVGEVVLPSALDGKCPGLAISAGRTGAGVH